MRLPRAVAGGVATLVAAACWCSLAAPPAAAVSAARPLRFLFTRYAADGATASIWVVSPTDGSHPGKVYGVRGRWATSARWNPRGTKIAFVRDHALWVMDAAGRHAHRVFNQRYVSNPVWSPDGRRLVFAWASRRGRDLFAIHADGTGLRRLTRTAAVSEFAVGCTPGGAIVATVLAPGGSVIRVFTFDGAARNRVGRVGDRAYDLSPDGTEVLFVRGARARIAAADGAGVSRVVPGLDAVAPMLAGTGWRVVSVRRLADGTDDLVSVRLDGTHRVRLTDNAVDDETVLLGA
ncbi:MAG: TolB family protein [Planctomycetaceae bacterium]